MVETCGDSGFLKEQGARRRSGVFGEMSGPAAAYPVSDRTTLTRTNGQVPTILLLELFSYAERPFSMWSEESDR